MAVSTFQKENVTEIVEEELGRREGDEGSPIPRDGAEPEAPIAKVQQTVLIPYLGYSDGNKEKQVEKLCSKVKVQAGKVSEAQDQVMKVRARLRKSMKEWGDPGAVKE